MDLKSILIGVGAIALADVALQLDNALAIASVASTLPPERRALLLAGGVVLAAVCLFVFTLVGSQLVERVAWLKPVAAVVLIVIGVKMLLDFAR